MRRRIAIIVLVGVLLSACSALTPTQPVAQQPTATSAASPAATVAATPTPAATPTVAATPTYPPVASATGPQLLGTAVYPAAPALPADAVLTVKLLVGSALFYYPDSEPMGQNIIRPVPASGAAPFKIDWGHSTLDPQLDYTVIAEITAGGKRIYAGRAALDVDAGVPTTIDLGPDPTATAVTGSVAFPASTTLPPGAVVTVQLERPIDGVGGPEIVGAQALTPNGSAPLPFSIPIDPAKLDPNAAYLLTATLAAPSRLAWQAAPQPVLTWGKPAAANLVLSAPPDSAVLGGFVKLPVQAALPPDATLSVQIAYIYNGAIGNTEREYRTEALSGTALPYTLEYVPSSLLPDQQYALYASIRQGARLLLRSPLVPLNPAAMPAAMDLTLAQPATLTTVRGTVSFPAEPPLAPNALLWVELADMRYAGGDGAPIVVAAEAIVPRGPGPYSFAIEVDPVTIDSRSPYEVRAAVRLGEAVFFRSLGGQPVLTQGNPTDVTLELQRAP